MCKSNLFNTLLLLSVLSFASCSKTSIKPKTTSIDTNSVDTTKNVGVTQNLPPGVVTTFGSNATNWITAMQSDVAVLSLESLNGNKISTDSQGNIYILFKFYGTLDIDPSTAVVIGGEYQDQVVLAKYSAAGKFIWSKQFTAASTTIICGLTCDAYGNIYCCLKCYNTSALQIDKNSYPLHNTAANTEIVKFSGSGNVLWLKEIGGSTIYDIAVDPAGNFYACGAMLGGVAFYNSPNDNILTYTGLWPNQYYWVKYDNNGNYVASSAIISTQESLDNVVYAPVLTVDINQNIYVGGRTSGEETAFDVTVPQGAFLAKYDKGGNPILFKVYTNDNSLIKIYHFYSLKADVQGNIYFFGQVNDASTDLLWKMDGQGNDLWNKAITANLSDGNLSLNIDDNNNVLVSGDCVVNPGVSTVIGNHGIFFNQYSSGGAKLFSKTLAGYDITDYIAFYNTAIDKNKNIDVIGYFNGSVDLLGTSSDPKRSFTDYYNSFFIAHFSGLQ